MAIPENINQVYTGNPITSNAGTDLMYFGQSPYGITNDAAMLYSNFAAQFVGSTVLTTKGDLLSFSTVNARLAVGASNGRILQVNSAAATGLAWSTATFPATGGAAGNVLISDGTNYIASTSLWPNTVGTSGKILQSNGTSNIYSTPTFPNVATSTGSFLYADGTNWVASTSLWVNTVGSSGKLVQSNGTLNTYTTATYPATATGIGTILRADGTNWVPTTSTFADTYAVSTLLYASASNVVSGLATANSAALVTNGSGVPAWQSLSAGQILVGTTAGAPTATAISSGTNITVANGSGTITVSATGTASFSWNNVTISTQLLAVNKGYMTNDVSLQVTYTLPATAAIGSIFAIAGNSSNGWTIAQNAGQNIQVGSVSSTIGVGGSVASSNRYDQVSFVCVVADTTFVVTSLVGNLTIV